MFSQIPLDDCWCGRGRGGGRRINRSDHYLSICLAYSELYTLKTNYIFYEMPCVIVSFHYYEPIKDLF